MVNEDLSRALRWCKLQVAFCHEYGVGNNDARAPAALYYYCNKALIGHKEAHLWTPRKPVSGTLREPDPFGCGRVLEIVEPADCVIAGGSAHVWGWLQPAAECGPHGASEESAAIVLVELYASNAGGFPVGHARDRARDRGRNAAGAAMVAAFHRRAPRSIGLTGNAAAPILMTRKLVSG